MKIDFKKIKRTSNGRGKGFNKLETNELKRKLVSFRVSDQEMNYIDLISKQKNIKISDYIREVLSENISREITKFPTLF